MTEAQHQNSHLRDAFIVAVIVGILLLFLIWIPWWWGKLTVSVVLLVFICVYLRHPKFWYRRYAGTVMIGWLTVSAADGFRIVTFIPEGFFNRLIVNNVDWAFHVACCFIVLTLLIFDQMRDRDYVLDIRIVTGLLPANVVLGFTIIFTVFLAANIFPAAANKGAFIHIAPLLLGTPVIGILGFLALRPRPTDLVPPEQRQLHLDVFSVLQAGWQPTKTAKTLSSLAGGNRELLSTLSRNVMGNDYQLIRVRFVSSSTQHSE